MQRLALAAFKAIDAAGMARVDFFVARDFSQVWLNEINTIPGMTPTSLLPKIAGAAGFSFGELCMAILERARVHTRKPEPPI